MAFNHSPKIVTDGLVLHLDAASPKSYVSGGTVWTDMSRSGNNGTLTNGPTFSAANGGSIVFDGVNDYINGTNISNLFTTDITAEVWVNIKSFSGDWFRIIGTGGNTGNRTFGLWYDNQGYLLYQRYGTNSFNIFTNIKVTTTPWAHIVITTIGSSHKVYLNSQIIGTSTTNGPWSASNENITLGYAGYYSYVNGNIAIAKLYTRGLSAFEILQNYKATKARFNL